MTQPLDRHCHKRMLGQVNKSIQKCICLRGTEGQHHCRCTCWSFRLASSFLCARVRGLFRYRSQMIHFLQSLLHPQTFSWKPYQTPLSSPVSLAWATLGYLVSVAILSWSCRKPLPVPKLVAPAHNLFLCLLSLVMFTGAFWEVMKVRFESSLCT